MGYRYGGRRPAGQPRIFVVEPNPFMLEVDQAILGPYELDPVAPRDLVALADKDHPDLAICRRSGGPDPERARPASEVR